MPKKRVNGLNPRKIGLALGIFTAFYLLVLGVFAGLLGWGHAVVSLLSSLYRGYDVTVFGILLGMIWGFLDGFIAGYVFSLIYNKVITL